jgi:TrmH family RNA methyltransferase
LTPIAARVESAQTYLETDLGGQIAVVLGSEAEGLTETWSDPRVRPVRIPMLGAADSLNVSVAAAVLLFEARRQRLASANQE